MTAEGTTVWPFGSVFMIAVRVDIVYTFRWALRAEIIWDEQKNTWLVSFLVDETGRVVLKTAFPSRKAHKLYRGRK